jgi:ankyrin repeat protein
MKNVKHVLCSVLSSCFWLSASPTPARADQAEPPTISPGFLSDLRSGEVNRVSSTRAAGANPNARDTNGNTALMWSAVYGDVRCLKVLVEAGAEVDATNALGATALMRSVFDYEKVRLLVEHGADVNRRSALGNSALILAARLADSHRVVEFLLDHGASARATNAWGATALMAAAAGGDEASIRALLARGSDVNAQPVADHAGFILGGGRSALMWAAYRADLTNLKLLLDAGADVNGEGFTGTPLSQAAWVNNRAAAQLLIERGARVDHVGHGDSFTALHWAASSEDSDPELVKLLIERGANPNKTGGEAVDAFVDVPQTALLLARQRGETPIVAALLKAGATNDMTEADSAAVDAQPNRSLPDHLDNAALHSAIAQAIAPLQITSIESKRAFVNHSSRQDCTSCHQQFLPMAAIGFAKKAHAPIDLEAERQLIEMVGKGELKNPEVDWEPLFHPEAVYTKGYALFAYSAEELPASEITDSWVHHLALVQGKDGRWLNNLPRPPIQTGDIGATALAIHALKAFPLPGRKAEFAQRVERARQWLRTATPVNHEGRVYQLLGLAWAGESSESLDKLAQALMAHQNTDGGWSQLPGLKSDAYATGEAMFALHTAGRVPVSDSSLERGRRFLLMTQLEDGTWHVHRRSFPFQPTMKSGFPHGRDSWISAAASSWAVMALSLEDETHVALGQ